MPAEPTTWRTTPACATEAMIEAGVARILAHFRSWEMSDSMARKIAAEMWDDMSQASPKPPVVSPWLPIGPDAKTGNDVLLASYANSGRITACWDDRCFGGNPGWETIYGTAYHQDAFDVWMPLPEAPVTGDAAHD